MPYKHLTITDKTDQAPGYGIDSLECRPIRDDLGAEQIGLTHYRMKPGRRVGFGHNHDAVEEMYVVTAGAGRFKVDDDLVDVTAGDVLYCSPEVMREWEAGSDGMDVIAFGAHVDGDGDMSPGWWTD
jgi:quercetin dioxygenase-like cupin family protein